MEGITSNDKTKEHRVSGGSIHLAPVADLDAMELNFRRRQEWRETKKKRCCHRKLSSWYLQQQCSSSMHFIHEDSTSWLKAAVLFNDLEEILSGSK